MTHNEKRTHWVKEGGIGLATGILFGLTNVVVGHVIFFLNYKLNTKLTYHFYISHLIPLKLKCKLKKVMKT